MPMIMLGHRVTRCLPSLPSELRVIIKDLRCSFQASYNPSNILTEKLSLEISQLEPLFALQILESAMNIVKKDRGSSKGSFKRS